MDEQPREVLGIDPRFHGVWYSLLYSMDGGETAVEDTPGGNLFCRVFATKIRLRNGEELIADRILSYVENGLVRCAVSILGMPHIWILTDMRPEMERTAMYQIINRERNAEIIRGICRVEI